MTTYNNGAGGSFTPDAITGYSSSSEHGNIVHRNIGSELVDVTLRPATLRTGELVLMFVAEAAAYAAEQLLRGAHVWTMTADELDTIGMQLVVQGAVRRELAAETGEWLVTFGWQEVQP